MAASEDRWWSRGYHPHFDATCLPQHVTFHLADSLPTKVLDRLADEVSALPPHLQAGERHHRIQQWLDAGHGCCLLREPWAAKVVEDALLHFDGERYQLIAWVIMPNHVHAVVEVLPGNTLSRTVASWKSYTGRGLAHAMPSGRVWLREYFDRYVRDQEHLATVQAYVDNNPVKAGLVTDAAQWPWSSARHRSAS